MTVCRPAPDDIALAWLAEHMTTDEQTAEEVMADLATLPGGIGAPLTIAAPASGTVESTTKIKGTTVPCRRFHGLAATLHGRTVVVGGTRNADGTIVGGTTIVQRLVIGSKVVKTNGLNCHILAQEHDGAYSVKVVLRHMLADEKTSSRTVAVAC